MDPQAHIQHTNARSSKHSHQINAHTQSRARALFITHSYAHLSTTLNTHGTYHHVHVRRGATKLSRNCTHIASHAPAGTNAHARRPQLCYTRTDTHSKARTPEHMPPALSTHVHTQTDPQSVSTQPCAHISCSREGTKRMYARSRAIDTHKRRTI
eukprot:6210590-Pleurochrysis_carterae.AAC.3